MSFLNDGDDSGNEWSFMGSGLASAGRKDLKGEMSEDFQWALKQVVHPLTLQEHKKAGADYPLTPEDQEGIKFKLSTRNSRYNLKQIDQIWRRRIAGEEKIMFHVIEYAENDLRNRREWEHTVGKRLHREFENVYEGFRLKQAKPVNAEEFYYIDYSPEVVREILAKHASPEEMRKYGIAPTPTQFYLDAGYNTFGKIKREDFINLPWEQLEDKCVRKPTVTHDQQFLMQTISANSGRTMTAPEQAIPPINQAPSGNIASSITGRQLGIMMSLDKDGQELGKKLLAEINAKDPERAVAVAEEAKQFMQTLAEEQERMAREGITVSKPLVVRSGKGYDDVTSFKENTGWVRGVGDKDGNIIRKEISTSDGKFEVQELDKNPESGENKENE